MPRGSPRGALSRPVYRRSALGLRVRALPRRQLTLWIATLVLAGGAGVCVTVVLASASARVDQLGPTTTVAIATRSLERGEVVGTDDVAWEALPLGAVAPAAITAADPDIVGRTVHERIEAREPIARTRLAPAPLVGVAAKTPAGRRAMAVPIGDSTPSLLAGQQVDLHAGGLPDGDGYADRSGTGSGVDIDRHASGPRIVAHRATVLEVADDRVTVAIADDEAAAVAEALIGGTIVIAVLGPN